MWMMARSSSENGIRMAGPSSLMTIIAAASAVCTLIALSVKRQPPRSAITIAFSRASSFRKEPQALAGDANTTYESTTGGAPWRTQVNLSMLHCRQRSRELDWQLEKRAPSFSNTTSGHQSAPSRKGTCTSVLGGHVSCGIQLPFPPAETVLSLFLDPCPRWRAQTHQRCC
jgi:hypothetical protein